MESMRKEKEKKKKQARAKFLGNKICCQNEWEVKTVP